MASWNYATCEYCPYGQIRVGDAKYGKCVKCTAGTYASIVIGADSKAHLECKPCLRSEGKYVNTWGTGCITCKDEWVLEDDPLQDKCVLCGYCAVPGVDDHTRTGCVECPPGQVPNVRKTFCVKCKAGWKKHEKCLGCERCRCEKDGYVCK